MIYIVITIFNRKKFTRACLEALSKQTYKDFKVIVVDDGSTDGSAEMIREEFPETILLFGDGNLFWTAATNMGVRYALERDATHVMALNDDTLPFEDFMEQMVRWNKEKPHALLGALDLEFATQKPYSGGERINWMLNRYDNLLDEIPEEEQTGLHESTHLPGRGLLIPREVFEKIGLFDEEGLPHYMADYDFTHRALRHGFKNYCNFDAKLYSYPDESADHKMRKAKSLKNYYRHLFDIKGAANLKMFTHYALRNCPPEKMPFFLVTGYFRRIVGYWVH